MPAYVRSVGVGVPSLRLDVAEAAAAWGERARGQVAACAADEDVLTLSWTAGAAALTAAGAGGSDVDGLWWGTTRPPYAEGPSHATLAASLGLSAHASGALTTGSAHAGMEALLGAWDAVAAGSVRTALVVTADAPLPALGSTYERRAGAGAAAVLLTSEAGAAALVSRATRTEPVLDRYRGDLEPHTRDTYDGRLFREQVFVPILNELGAALAAGGKIRRWSLPEPDGRLGRAVAKRLGATLASDVVDDALGDTGAAAALLGATAALGTPGRVAVVGYGGGRASGVTLDVTVPVPGADVLDSMLLRGRPASYAEVLRARGQLVPGGETVPMGVPPGSAGFIRGAREMLQLLGARCVDCDMVNTPPSVHPHCIGCGGTKFTDVPLARRGVVHTFVVNQAMPAPFVAPLPLAVLDLEDGARVMLQVTGDAGDLAIGDDVKLVLRRYALERGAPVYGWKAERVAA